MSDLPAASRRKAEPGEVEASEPEPTASEAPEERAQEAPETPEAPIVPEGVPVEEAPTETPEGKAQELEAVIEPPLENRGDDGFDAAGRVHAHAPQWTPREPNAGW